MQTKKQAGFTLIELMIVVAIVGILAAVAIPAYQDYIKRSKVSELAATLAACKTSLAETYATNGNNFGSITSADDAGCSTTGSQYVSALTVNGSLITATADSTTTGVTGTLTLTAQTDATTNDIIGWTCAGTIDNRYKPANCR